MPRVRDLLYRFRPSGTPGAASAAGVPADRLADVTAELEPVLATLADVERECADIVRQAHQDATRVGAQAKERAQGTVAAARQRIEAERAAAAAAVRQRGESETAATLAAAEEDAAAVRRVARDRAPGYLDEVVARVRGLLGEEHLLDERPVGAP